MRPVGGLQWVHSRWWSWGKCVGVGGMWNFPGGECGRQYLEVDWRVSIGSFVFCLFSTGWLSDPKTDIIPDFDVVTELVFVSDEGVSKPFGILLLSFLKGSNDDRFSNSWVAILL